MVSERILQLGAPIPKLARDGVHEDYEHNDMNR